MNLTTIFTGHTLDLREIVAIGPPISFKKDGIGYLTIDIHLRAADLIRHYAYGIEHYNFNELKYNECLDKLIEQRAALLQQWEKAKAGNLPYTDEPTVEYRTSDADNSQSIIEFDHE